MSERHKNNKGLTVIELLIFISVIALLSGVAWNGVSSYYKTQALNTAAQTVLSALSQARSKTVSGVNDTQYGVYLASSRVVVFPGSVFSEPNANNIQYNLEYAVKIASTSLQSSTSTIVFSLITGEATNYGTITISSRTDASRTKVVKISKTGEEILQ